MAHPTKNKKQRKTKNEKRHMHALKSALLLIVLNLLQFSDFQFKWVLKKTQQFFFYFLRGKSNPHATSTHFQVRVRKVKNLNLPVFTAGPTSRRLHAILIASSLKVFTRIHAYCRGLYQVHSQ